ncbi:MAG: hypothetical protein ACLGPL_11360 [Acidobacteriota bacterium]
MSGKEDMKLVYIEWVDSFTGPHTWKHLEEIEPEALVCRSVGWLAHDGEDVKVLIPHVAAGDTVELQGCGGMTIPAKAINRMVELDVEGGNQ